MSNQPKELTIAILAKDKESTLPLYLECLDKQTFPKELTHLWIRSNNNRDRSSQLLQSWANSKRHLYKTIVEDYTPCDEQITHYKNHEWNPHRFNVLGKIRQESINYAATNNTDYFVADCDNFIKPHVITSLQQSNLPVIGPLLHLPNKVYSNYHHATDDNGYFADNPLYYTILNRQVTGLIRVNVIHCTYFIKHEVLHKVRYSDNSDRHEYVIFSETCRANNVEQYIDNRTVGGYLTFIDESTPFPEHEFRSLLGFNNNILSISPPG